MIFKCSVSYFLGQGLKVKQFNQLQSIQNIYSNTKKQPNMASINNRTFFIEDLQNDESNTLDHQLAHTKRKNKEMTKLLDKNMSKQNEASVGQIKKWFNQCSKWAYFLILALLAGFFLAKAFSQIYAVSENRNKFAENLQILRQTTIDSGEHLPSGASNVKTRSKEIPNIQFTKSESRKINFKINQANQVKQQTYKSSQQTTINSPPVDVLIDQKLLQLQKKVKENVNYVVPQNTFIPYVPEGQKIQILDTPTSIPPLMQASPNMNKQQLPALNNYPQNTQNNNPTIRVVTPNPTPTVVTDFQFQSYGQPFEPSTQKQSSSISPTIQPFNSVPTQNDYGFEGSFAGITLSQQIRARQLRELLSKDMNNPDPLAEEEKKYYEQRYSISKYQELPFCIVVPTYNNAARDRYLNNIKSIVMQDYSNYHIVVIDDASDDNTGGLIKKYLDDQTKVSADRYKIIRNTVQQKAMPNLRNAAQDHCKAQQIFLIVDGDDELLGKQVLKLFNSVFQEKKLWFVYSNFLSTTGGVGFSRPFPVKTIQNNQYRTYPFVTSHLRAFYTKLFVNIKEQDIKDQKGEYYRAANDVAICIPILEQAGERVGYLPEMTYYYNSNTGLNNHFVRLNEQRTNDQMIRRKGKYQRLENLMD